MNAKLITPRLIIGSVVLFRRNMKKYLVGWMPATREYDFDPQDGTLPEQHKEEVVSEGIKKGRIITVSIPNVW